jgi:hypothetical protein
VLAERAIVAASTEPAELAHDFAKLTADLLHRAVWHRIAAVADRHSEGDELRRLSAKVISGRWR